MERYNAEITSIDQQNDKIEEEKEQEVLDWVEQEERREREAREIEQKKKEEDQKKKDEDWMLDQLKKEYGDDFGEDVNIDF